MIRPALCALSVLLSASATARAAGFNCTTARVPRERLVCSDATLSAADSKLNEIYTAALRRLSPDGGRILRQSQLGWLRYLDAFCPMMADPAQHAAAVSCVSQVYSDRIRDLQMAAVQNGPFLFSRVDRYSVSELVTRAGPYDTGLAQHHVAYPRIDQPVTRQTVLWNALAVRTDQPSSCDAGDGDTWTDYRLNLVTAKLISVTWTNSDYCHGTSHGFGTSETQTLVLSPQPHPLTPGDLFRSDRPWADRLANLLLKGVRRAAQDKQMSFDERHAAHIAEVAQDTRRWSLGMDGVGFQFDPYELGSHIFQPYVVVRWTDLRDVMVSNPPIP